MFHPLYKSNNVELLLSRYGEVDLCTFPISIGYHYKCELLQQIPRASSLPEAVKRFSVGDLRRIVVSLVTSEVNISFGERTLCPK